MTGNAVAIQLFPRMSESLRKAFHTAYITHGKISTSKLIAAFAITDTAAAAVAFAVVAKTGYSVPATPAAAADGSLEWITASIKISPCVQRTCAAVLTRGVAAGEEVDALAFFEVLAVTAVELSRLVGKHAIDVAALVADARKASAKQ